MKVCIFSDPTWALGRTGKDIKKSLTDYEVDIVDWSGHSQQGVQDIYDLYDVIIVNIAGKWVVDHIADKRKFLFRSDGSEEFLNKTLEEGLVYASVSESLFSMFPPNSKVFWTPVGADPSHFTFMDRKGALNKIGWCGAPRVPIKQSHWAIEIARRSDIPFTISSALPCEHNVQIWQPLPFEKVVEWYSSIDLLLVTSVPDAKSEGAPLPAFEAILCGIPVIGTPVGNFLTVPGPKFTTVEEGIEIVNRLKENPEELSALAKEQYAYVMKYFTYDAFAYRWKEAIEYVHERNINPVPSKLMKVLVFADTEWSVGRVNKDVVKYMTDIKFEFMDWRNFDWSIFIQQFENCDVCLTNIVSIKFLQNTGIPFDFEKCVFMSHGYIDNNATDISNLMENWVYGITSESIRGLFPNNLKIFLMPNGVEPSHFKYEEKVGILKTLGWCGSKDVPSKQHEWATSIATQTELILDFACTKKFSEICDWYSTIDLLLVTSMPHQHSETGPLPAFEAIVSGVPVIGTPVGNFKDIPGPKFTTIEEAVGIVTDLKTNPQRMKDIAREQYEYVMKNYTYESFAHKWREALEYVYLRNKRIGESNGATL